MDKKTKLDELYEKLYFFEIENKGKIDNRIQIVFGLEVILFTMVTYLIKNTDLTSNFQAAVVCLTSSIISGYFLIVSAINLKYAFWGNTFKYIPNPKDIHNHNVSLIQYEQDIIAHYKKLEIPYNKECCPVEKVNIYINKQFIDCTSHNTELNEYRSKHVYAALRYMFISLVPLIISALIFLSMDLDAASPRHKNTQIHTSSIYFT